MYVDNVDKVENGMEIVTRVIAGVIVVISVIEMMVINRKWENFRKRWRQMETGTIVDCFIYGAIGAIQGMAVLLIATFFCLFLAY